jgi:hypothetical protein
MRYSIFCTEGQGQAICFVATTEPSRLTHIDVTLRGEDERRQYRLKLAPEDARALADWILKTLDPVHDNHSRIICEQATALDRYRYAVAWASADAWDHGSEMRARFTWARAEDDGACLSNDRAAAIGKQFLAREETLMLNKISLYGDENLSPVIVSIAWNALSP